MSNRIRVGEVGSIVQAGDINPETGEVYKNGQYAPTIEELYTSVISSANKASLLPSRLPIYDDIGNLSPKKLEAWNPSDTIHHDNITLGKLPKFTAAGLAIALLDVGDVNYINYARQENIDGLIAARVSVQKGKFLGGILISPKFFQFMTVPIKPAVPNRSSGISVATYLMYHAFGHLLYARIAFDGRVDLMNKFSQVSGWSKHEEPSYTKGEFLTLESPSSWRYNVNISRPTEASKWNPMNDFAESYALYFLNEKYLNRSSHNRHEVVQEIIRHYKSG